MNEKERESEREREREGETYMMNPFYAYYFITFDRQLKVWL